MIRIAYVILVIFSFECSADCLIDPFAWRPKRSRTLLSFFLESTEAGEKFGKFFCRRYDRTMILRGSTILAIAMIFAGCPTKEQTVPVTRLDKQAIRDRANATHEDLNREEKKSDERKQNE